MNIFFTNYSPETCAQEHVDKHVVKMVLETAQLLSGAVQQAVGRPIDGLYRPTHMNHPCARWVRTNHDNFRWTVRLGIALGREFEHRYGKVHKSTAVILQAMKYGCYLNNGPTTLPPRAMPMEFNAAPTAVEAYRLYVAARKSHLASWTKRDKPWWWDQAREKAVRLGLARDIRNLENNSVTPQVPVASMPASV